MHWSDGNLTPESIEKLEIDRDKGNNSDEETLTLMILIPRMKKIMTSLMMLKFKLVQLK